MKQLTVISGKGGTGKTSLTACFAALAKNAVLADCDVDASDLHLILKPEIRETQEFTGLKIATIDAELCTKCMKCYESCRFGAIDEDIIIDTARCEGCGVCAFVCPEHAVELVDRKSGEAFISDTRFGPMAHAKLNIAEEASGKLVTIVRANAQKLAKKHNRDLIIIDGPPGIGCPVIAAITNVDLVLVVTEPTLSGIYDLERILGVAKHFGIPAVVCINKYDINEENTKKIEDQCRDEGLEVVGKLPYDDVVTKAMIAEKSVVEYSDDDFSKLIKDIWAKLEVTLK
jgi:MinD superfamily P-loop ATPase